MEMSSGKKSGKSVLPRKLPKQERSRAMVEKIFLATRNLLIEDGLDSLTTSRVALRAGMSVGSLYQYFPNKQAVIQALYSSWLGEVQTLFAEFEKSIPKNANRNTVCLALFDKIYSDWESELDELKFTCEMNKAMKLHPELGDLDIAHGKMIAGYIAGILRRLGSVLPQEKLLSLGLYLYTIHSALEEQVVISEGSIQDILPLHKKLSMTLLNEAFPSK